jgi:spoIIIJ-associated protein
VSAPQQPTTEAPATDDDSTTDAVDEVTADATETDEAEETGGADDLLVREGDVAGDYLERLLDILDVEGDIDLDVEGDRASVAIVGGRLGDLIGPDGATLEALQDLTRLAVHRETGVRSRLMLDIGGHRARRREKLTALGTRTAQQVLESGEPVRLDPMTPFERKVVHDAVSAVDGVRSESEGEEPQRRIVVSPA